MICGTPGSGKSTLALELMALGAELIADDGVLIDLETAPGTVPFLQRPDTATDLIESRGIGLLRAGPVCGRAIFPRTVRSHSVATPNCIWTAGRAGCMRTDPLS